MSFHLLGLQSLALVFIIALAPSSSAYNAYEDIGDDFAPTSPEDEDRYYKVPPGFLIGAGTSAYQIEGGWNEDGKSKSIWDVFMHKRPWLKNGDVACNSYHEYKKDVYHAKNLKLDFYRFSLSWPRLLPDGSIHNVNQAGVDYYNNLINELINNGITPLVTIHHWDLPETLELRGGWAGDPSIQDYFLEFAKFVFKTFGDRVKMWITINEPHKFCLEGYETGNFAPGISDPGVAMYKCGHNMILAHAKAYRAYYHHYAHQKGQVGITVDMGYYYVPLNLSSPDDRAAAERGMVFQYAWFADPLRFGHYPTTMRDIIDTSSKAEGRKVSRLPTFTRGERKLLLGAVDFLAVNHYITSLATSGVPKGSANPSNDRDVGLISQTPSNSTIGTGFSTSTPWAIRGILNWLKDRYDNFPTFVTENGYQAAADEGLADHTRVSYLSGFLRATVRAVNEDGCNVHGYSYWSFMDSCEWTSGYSVTFGLLAVNRSDAYLTRTPRDSAHFLTRIITSRRVEYHPFKND